MNNKKLIPEEEELIQKEELFRILENELLEKELELSILKRNIQTFENEYMKVVGIKLAKLENLKSRLMEVFLEFNNSSGTSNTDFETKSENVYNYSEIPKEELFHDPRINDPVKDEIKDLYRKIAKKIHPDLSTDENQRIIREELMKRANVALSMNDSVKLLEILNEWESRPESVQGDDPVANLIRIIRKIAKVKTRLSIIEDELSQIKNLDIFKIYKKYDEASYTGVNLLNKITDEVDLEFNRILNQVQLIITTSSI